MYVRKEKKRVFKPALNFHSLLKEAPRLTNEVQNELDKDRIPEDMPSVLTDGETGEQITFTKARWTAKEGRLSLNAKMVLDMGTGRLDIKGRTSDSQATPPTSSPSKPVRHDLVTKFLASGPLTPYMHKDWNPRRDIVETAEVMTLSDDDSNLNEELDDFNVNAFSTVSTVVSSPTPLESRSHALSTIASSAAASYSDDQWGRLLNKVYLEVFGVAEKMERNKSLTKEAGFPGGVKALQRTCWQLAKLKVKHTKELAQAIDDEQLRECKREQAESESWENLDILQTLRRTHRAERVQGKAYIDSLQRDQEIIFMRKMKELGLLW